MDPADRAADAGRSGVGLEQLAEVVGWVTARLERGFAWSHAFLDLPTVREFTRHFLPEAFRVLQIALVERLGPSFLSIAAPRRQQGQAVDADVHDVGGGLSYAFLCSACGVAATNYQ
jgi:hypothetical protein